MLPHSVCFSGGRDRHFFKFDFLGALGEGTIGIPASKAGGRCSSHGTDLSTKGYTNVEVFINGDSGTTRVKEQIQASVSDKTIGCYPNPFNPMTVIRYSMPQEAFISINIFNINGGLVRNLLNNKIRKPGVHSIQWNGKDDKGMMSGSGEYYYKVVSGDRITAKKMIFLK